jgi:hypothetical protein
MDVYVGFIQLVMGVISGAVAFLDKPKIKGAGHIIAGLVGLSFTGVWWYAIEAKGEGIVSVGLGLGTYCIATIAIIIIGIMELRGVKIVKTEVRSPSIDAAAARDEEAYDKSRAFRLEADSTTTEPSRESVEAASRPEPKPKETGRPPQEPSAEERAQPTGLFVGRRKILMTALVIVIGLSAWGIYSFAFQSTSTPLPTPASMSTNTIVQYFGIGENSWVTGPDRMVMISSVEKVSSYSLSTGETFKAPFGKAFLFITVTCRNIGTTSLVTGPAYFLLTDSSAYSYQDQTYSGYVFSKPYPNASLAPSIAISGKILWIVPISASGLEISYLLDPAGTPPVEARWRLP